MKRKLLKALKAINATSLQYKMALILYQVNGYDSALAFIGDLEKQHGSTDIRTDTG